MRGPGPVVRRRRRIAPVDHGGQRSFPMASWGAREDFSLEKGGTVMLRKGMIGGAAAVLALLFVSAVYACWGGWGSGYGMGYGPGADTAQMQKFYDETQDLRDALMSKRVELRNEYRAPAPDTGRIADLRREIAALQAQLRSAARDYGLPAGGGPGMMMGMDAMMTDMCPDMCGMGW